MLIAKCGRIPHSCDARQISSSTLAESIITPIPLGYRRSKIYNNSSMACAYWQRWFSVSCSLATHCLAFKAINATKCQWTESVHELSDQCYGALSCSCKSLGKKPLCGCAANWFGKLQVVEFVRTADFVSIQRTWCPQLLGYQWPQFHWL